MLNENLYPGSSRHMSGVGREWQVQNLTEVEEKTCWAGRFAS